MRLLKERADKANARTTASVRELARVKDQLQVGQAAQAELQYDMAAASEAFPSLHDELLQAALSFCLASPAAAEARCMTLRAGLETSAAEQELHAISTIAYSAVLQLLHERSGKHTGRLRSELLQSNKERSALESDLQTALDRLAKYKRK